MPGKRARRHFSQLSEFERDLIIGMKTAGWSTRRVAGQVDRSECAVRNCWQQSTREGTHAWKTGSGATRKTARREDRGIVRQALVDLTVTRSTIRAGVKIMFDSSSFVNPTPLAHADTSRDVLPRGGTSQGLHLLQCLQNFSNLSDDFARNLCQHP
ncbi:uncharacterized protein TNCV_3569611 [Trichonephila clavipes]|nr:uncharacterized protein TNCV_3569611 [Trichonephila clavipes]